MTDATITINGQSITIQLSDEQINALTKQQVHPILWQPKYGSKHYFVRHTNEVENSIKNDDLPYYDVFETRLQAEEFANYRAALALYKAAIVQFNDGWEADFSNTDQLKYFLTINYDIGTITVEYNVYYQYVAMSFYFKSRDFYTLVKESTVLANAFKTIINYKG